VLDTGTDGGLPENSWCGGELEAPGTTLRGEIPTIRCVMPTREQIDLEADPDVLRTLAAHADRCLGIYASVEHAGMIAVGDELRVRRPEPPPRIGALTRASKTTFKRTALRAAHRLIPGE
jgi:uncharacterized protein YcbX